MLKVGVTGILEVEKRDNGSEEIIEEVLIEKIQNLLKEFDL